MPYAESVESLVEQQFARYYTWLQAMEKAGIEHHLFLEAGGSLLKSAWNPVRLNKLGTVEIRCIDRNYSSVTLAVITLLDNAAHRVRREKLTVRPTKAMQIFELVGDAWVGLRQRLYVPDFEYLNGELLYTSVTEKVKNPKVKAYVDSILQFAIRDTGEGAKFLAKLSQDLDHYQTIEAEILQEFIPTTAQLPLDVGLRLVHRFSNQKPNPPAP